MRKSIFKRTKITSSLLVVIIPIMALVYPFVNQNAKQDTLSTDTVSLAKCTDGDTAHFNINGEDIVVRLLAVDTPETVKPNTPVQPYGKEASEYTCNALTNASEIRLEYETGNRTDKYNRLLAWVFVDDQLLQSMLIEKGLAKVDYIYGDYKYTNRLYVAEENAKSKRVGMWQ